jgi:hypothetical protein
MNEKDLNELLNKGDRTAFLLGKVTGGLSVIIQLFNNNLVHEAEEEIHRLFKSTMKSIDEIYYNKKEEVNE